MSNPAQDEVDRLFSDKTQHKAHPEDRHENDELQVEQEKSNSRRTIRSSTGNQDREEDDDSDFDDINQDTSRNLSSFTGTKSAYKVPSTRHYANTGPKGVIADAQSYHRSKRNASRDKLQSSLKATATTTTKSSNSNNNNNINLKQSKRDSDSDVDLSQDEGDEEFMQVWRQRRLQELREQSAADAAQRRTSPSRRVYGRLDTVDATGYLDAVEKCPAESVVVVLIYDPADAQSEEASEELERLAYKWTHVRFIKLDHEIAEMETLEIPAILAYKAGDVFATVSGAKSEGLEEVLKRHGVLTR